jgi:hypothetical protein
MKYKNNLKESRNEEATESSAQRAHKCEGGPDLATSADPLRVSGLDLWCTMWQPHVAA